MLSKVTVNTQRTLDGRKREALRRSLAAIPGVRQVTLSQPNRVEVHYDAEKTQAGRLMTVIRAFAGTVGL